MILWRQIPYVRTVHAFVVRAEHLSLCGRRLDVATASNGRPRRCLTCARIARARRRERGREIHVVAK